MDYVQITTEQQRKMLGTIGTDSIDELYVSLPKAHRLSRPLRWKGAANRSPAACFLGGGAYDHFIPATVNALTGNGAIVTAYTPYQAEASQGALQAFFEFQTQICRLTDLDVANASLYEGASATAEAVMMALNVTAKRRVLVGSTLHPQYRQVLRTYLRDLPQHLPGSV